MNNIPPSIQQKIGRRLYTIPNHPICILKERIFQYFQGMTRIELDNPYVKVENNFDRLLVPANHPSRRPTDTFYQDKETCLRTHMTSYLYPLGKSATGNSSLRYITCGDVYRKDAIDATHYPVFHQMDGFYIVDEDVDVKQHLRQQLSGLVKHLFGEEVEYQLLEDYEHEDVYFPFTINSVEVSVKFQSESGDKYLEVLGAGTVHPDIMRELGLEKQQAWALGLGLERLAMVMFDIPDIRLFWSTDARFLNQFEEGKITQFQPFSKYELCYKDVSFFLSDRFSYNDLCSIARDEDRDNMIESITLIDEFRKKGRASHCYRIAYRSMDRTLLNSEVDHIQESIRRRLTNELGLEIR